MFDPDLIDAELNPAARLRWKEALSVLAESGLYERQIQRLVERLAAGDESEDPASIAKQVVETRLKTRVLRSLQEIGNQYTEELKNG